MSSSSGSASSPLSPPLVPGLPAHTQVLAETLDRAVEHALTHAARGTVKADGSLEDGAPSHALILSLPQLALRHRPRRSADETSTSDALVRSALHLLLPPSSSSNGTREEGPPQHEQANTWLLPALEMDAIVLTLPSEDERRSVRAHRRASCLAGVSQRGNGGRRGGAQAARCATPLCVGADVAALLVRIDRIPLLLSASSPAQRRGRGGPAASSECAHEAFAERIVGLGAPFRVAQHMVTTLNFTSRASGLSPMCSSDLSSI